MYRVIAVSFLAAALAADASGKPDGPERQANCGKAIEHVLHELRQPVEAREKARKDELEARILALIAENRRKGIDECITWNQVMKLTFKQ